MPCGIFCVSNSGWVIGLRYTKQLAQSKAEVKEETISSSELEEKRLHAMEQLYGKGEVHDK